jgi:hypothetical protein
LKANQSKSSRTITFKNALRKQNERIKHGLHRQSQQQQNLQHLAFHWGRQHVPQPAVEEDTY